jgi:hypothetical protein
MLKNNLFTSCRLYPDKPLICYDQQTNNSIMKIIQTPNPPLIIALAAYGATFVTHGTLQAVSTATFYIALSIWAYEELKNGVNWFRRCLGGVVGLYIIVNLSMRLLHS